MDPKTKPFWIPDTQGFLAIAIIGLVGFVVVILLYRPVAVENKDILNIALGVLLGSLKDVYSFFFGSSKGSEKKDDALISGAVSPTSTPPIVPPSQPIGVTETPVVVKPADVASPVMTAAAKALGFFGVMVASLMFMAGDAHAQTRRPALQITGNPVADTKANFGVTGNVAADANALWQKIIGSSLNDLNYAAAMAKQANTLQSAQRLQCVNAIINLNEQASGANLKNADGTAMTKPDPHAFTDFETLAEITDNLAPTGPLFVSCAGAAQLAKTSVLAFVNALVAGSAGLAAMPVIPGL